MIAHAHLDADRAEGEWRKADRLDLLEARRQIYIHRGRRALLLRLLECGTATADDVRAAVELPPGINAKLFGAVPTPLAKAGLICSAGFARTSRATAHARPVTEWALVDRDAATRWLTTHADIPDNPFPQTKTRQRELPGIE